MKKTPYYLIPVLVCFLLGFIAGRIQSDAIENWYPLLDKPALTPPNIAFPIAWSVIYLCIGISAGLILSGDSPRKKRLIALFCVQLLFNFAWSVAFFYFRSPLAGLVDILILDALVAAYVVQSRRASKAASALFAPYVLWLLFATIHSGLQLTGCERPAEPSPTARAAGCDFYRAETAPRQPYKSPLFSPCSGKMPA